MFPKTEIVNKTKGHFTLSNTGLSEIKVDNHERNALKSKTCPRAHCETHPLMTDLELWRPKTA